MFYVKYLIPCVMRFATLMCRTASLLGAVDRRGRTTLAHMGYLWWLKPVTVEGVARSYQARGNGGQAIIVLPELKMVAAVTGHAHNAPLAEALAPFQLVTKHLVPMVRREPFMERPS
jgi:CubicO group peptidase (beta-lactamase class C family)